MTFAGVVVVDVEFARNEVPRVYDALKVEGTEITLEVQQQLGDGVVRTIALGSSDGLRRGLMVSNTGNPITPMTFSISLSACAGSSRCAPLVSAR